MAMAEERLITIVDVANPDDESYGYVKTIPRQMTEEDLEKMKPVLKKAGAYKFFRMDFNFADGPAVKEFLESVELEEFKRAEKLKVVQDDMKGIVAGKEVVINADLVEEAFGLIDDGLNISRPNKKSHDLHMFYIKPVHSQKCSTKRGINLKHFKSEFSYIPNFARQVCAYCTGLMSEGYINFSQYRAVDFMIRKQPVNWNRYLLQNFQDRFRKFRTKPFNLYFGGTLTALIYKALGVDYSLVSRSKVPLPLPPPTIKKRGRPFTKNVDTTPKVRAVQHPSTLVIPQELALVEVVPSLASLEVEETPVVLAERSSLRTSTLKKRKAFPPLKSRKGKVPRIQPQKDILERLELRVKKRRGRAAPPRPVTMGKFELLTKFSHRSADLDAEMQDKLTTMYYTASGIKPRRKADLGYKGRYTLSRDEVQSKCEQYYALEEELLLEHIIAKTVLEKTEKRFKELKKALVSKDEETAERSSEVMVLEASLEAKNEEIEELQAELERLRSSMGGEEAPDVEMTEADVQGGEAPEVEMNEAGGKAPDGAVNEADRDRDNCEAGENTKEAEKHADAGETVEMEKVFECRIETESAEAETDVQMQEEAVGEVVECRIETESAEAETEVQMQETVVEVVECRMETGQGDTDGAQVEVVECRIETEKTEKTDAGTEVQAQDETHGKETEKEGEKIDTGTEVQAQDETHGKENEKEGEAGEQRAPDNEAERCNQPVETGNVWTVVSLVTEDMDILEGLER